ncbi:MAG: adenosine kinase [Acidimicrobiia bacterium]
MNAPTLDVLAVGNALVDVLSHEEDDFLGRIGMVKSSMTLIDEDVSHHIYAQMGPAVEISGGSAGNTAVGVAAFGGRVAFVGRTRDDQIGELYRHDIQAAGVQYAGSIASDGPASGRSYVIVTPDANRTMCTFLGAANQISPADLPDELIESAAITYTEGYLWDQPAAKDAVRALAERTHAAGRKFAFTLSDSFCVERHRKEFLALAEREVDILFANEAEICALYEVDEFDAALQHVRGHCEIAALTRSEKGSVIVAGDEVHVIDAHPVDEVIDTTGAGDLYAAGVLYGIANELGLARAGHLGSVAAAEVIAHLGARPEDDLRVLGRLFDEA